MKGNEDLSLKVRLPGGWSDHLPKKLFGPVGFDGHNRAFFFVNHEQYRLPIQVSRQRTVFNPLAQRGVFQYNVLVAGQTQVRQVDLLALAARQNNPKIGSTIDPTVGKLLEDIQHSTEGTGNLAPQGDPNLQRFTITRSRRSTRAPQARPGMVTMAHPRAVTLHLPTARPASR